MQNIKTATNGRILMGAGTLYGALSALLEKGYIAEVKSNDSSKRKYQRTEPGTSILETEIQRLKELLVTRNDIFNFMIIGFGMKNSIIKFKLFADIKKNWHLSIG